MRANDPPPPEPFDHALVPAPRGLINTGSICYMNSFLQSLLTCTSVTRFFLARETEFRSKNNKVAVAYIDLIKVYSAAPSTGAQKAADPSNLCREIIAATLGAVPSKKNFGEGQEDSGEVLNYFLGAVGSPELDGYFSYSYVRSNRCLNCRAIASAVRGYDMRQMEVHADHLSMTAADLPSGRLSGNHPLNSFLDLSYCELDGYKCPHCEGEQHMRVEQQLLRVPEVIIVLFAKFTQKVNISYPLHLFFPSDSPANGRHHLTYKVVATIDHVGGMSGGHYWSNALRSTPLGGGGANTLRLLRLDDETVSDGDPSPTPLTYFVFYHCCEKATSEESPFYQTRSKK